MTEKKLTRSEAVEVITIACTSKTRAAVVIDKLADAGVPFAPEPVAPKRGDLLTENTELVDGMIVRTNEHWKSPYMWDKHEQHWVTAYGNSREHARMVGDSFNYYIRDIPGVVDTPEPAPEYTARRSADGNIWIGDQLFAYDAPRERVERVQGYHARRSAQYQAALDLLDREEAEASK